MKHIQQAIRETLGEALEGYYRGEDELAILLADQHLEAVRETAGALRVPVEDILAVMVDYLTELPAPKVYRSKWRY